MNNIKRLAKGVARIDKYLDGQDNLEMGINDDLAMTRADICTGCPMFQKEPLAFLRVDDKAVPVLSGKMCDECGCVLSYKLRLKNEKCPLGKW